MDPTNPIEGQTNPTAEVTQETPVKSNVQSRIDEITAEKHAYAKQVEQLTATVAALMQRENEARAQVQAPQPQAPKIPEGVDPNMAQFFMDQFKAMQAEQEKRTQQMYWQLQNQYDQSNVQQKYSNLPTEVLKDAANRLTALKQQYGQNVNMDDAVAIAHFEYFKRQGQVIRQQQYNQMAGPMGMQSPLPQHQTQSNQLVSPASLPDWDNLPDAEKWRRIDEYEKKGGRLM